MAKGAKEKEKAWGVFCKSDVAKLVAGLAVLRLTNRSCLIVEFPINKGKKGEVHLKVSDLNFSGI